MPVFRDAGDISPSQKALFRASDVASNSEAQLFVFQGEDNAPDEDNVGNKMAAEIVNNDVAATSTCRRRDSEAFFFNMITNDQRGLTKKATDGKKKMDVASTSDSLKNIPQRKLAVKAKVKQSKPKPAAEQNGRKANDVAPILDARVLLQDVIAIQKSRRPKSIRAAVQLGRMASRLEDYAAQLASAHIRKDIKTGLQEMVDDIRRVEQELRQNSPNLHSDCEMQQKTENRKSIDNRESKEDRANTAPTDVLPKTSQVSNPIDIPIIIDSVLVSGGDARGTPKNSPKHVAKRRRVQSNPGEEEAGVSATAMEVELAKETPTEAVANRNKKRKSKKKKKPTDGTLEGQKKTSAGTSRQWTEVVKTQKRKPKGTAPNPETKARTEQGSAKSARVLQAPRTEAIVISAVKEGMTHAEVLRLAKGSVDPVAMSAKIVATRRTKAGDLLLEVKGKESADTLARKIGEAVKDHAKVWRPQVMRQVMLLGVDPSVTTEETRVALQTGTGISVDGSAAIVLRPARNGTQCARVNLPLKDAIALSKKGHIQIGWTRARVKVLDPRPLRCFRCLGHGHVAKVCTGPDRTKLCFRCGEEGHAARGCKSTPKCVVCEEAGKPAGHPYGSGGCGLKTDKKSRK
jgi:hypothetical protein